MKHEQCGRHLSRWSLTHEAKAQIPGHVRRWVDVVMRTRPQDDADRARCTEAIIGMYAAAGLSAPRVVFATSPLMAAVVYGAAAAYWYHVSAEDLGGNDTRAVTDAAGLAATAVATEAATEAATEFATASATRAATAAATTRAATEFATEAATRGATEFATASATRAATASATRAATRIATDAATEVATRIATRDATEAVMRIATDADTEAATRAATEGATAVATRVATEFATEVATRAATAAATRAATRIATDAATAVATRAATQIATEVATAVATDAATEAATEFATRIATDTATDATSAATRIATDAVTEVVIAARAEDVTFAATEAVMRNATEGHLIEIMISAAMAVVRARNPKITERFVRSCIANAYNTRNGGNHWAGWPCYLSFVRDVVGWSHPSHENFAHYERAAIHGSHRYMHQKFCVVSDFPSEIHTNAARQPHNESGPSIAWRDGFAAYHIDGMFLGKSGRRIVMDPRSLTVDEIDAETNNDIRGVMISRRGAIEYLVESGATVLDERRNEIEGTHEALLVDALGMRYLWPTCPSGKPCPLLRVPRTIDSCLAASAWLAGDRSRATRIVART